MTEPNAFLELSVSCLSAAAGFVLLSFVVNAFIASLPLRLRNQQAGVWVVEALLITGAVCAGVSVLFALAA